MVGRIAPRTTVSANESELSLRFGGGLNTRASSDEIDERECSDGQNFDLDLGNTQWRPRAPFDLAGTAPNAGRINGFAQLVAADGSISTIIQAGDTVYKLTDWDTWSSVGTVSSSARLRGPRQHIWNLDDVVLVSDLALQEEVLQWDGTTLTNVYHNLTGPFKAKYIFIDNERAYYGNVSSNSVVTPHVVVGSERSDYTILSTVDRPSSSLAAGDAFFLPMPDLKPINGMAGSFGVLAISTLRGEIYKLTGSSSQDYEVDQFYYGSYADGIESMVNAGNDIVFGRPGRIESLTSTDAFGDVETDDLSLKISNAISSYTGWRMAYSSRHQRIYCHPDTQAEIWVLHKPLIESGLSPWMRWRTSHSMGFNPTTMWTMLDVESGLEYVYCGDSSGKVYRLEGSGTSGDGGTDDIKSYRTSKLVMGPGHSQSYDVQGSVKFRPVTGDSALLFLHFFWQGENVYDTSISVSLASAEAGALFGGEHYFGGDVYFGNHFEGRLARQRFGVPGESNDLQVYVEITDTLSFQINEIYFGFRAAG